MIRFLSVLLFTFAISGISSSQDISGYSISLKISGMENRFVSIAFHLGDKQYIKDTVSLDESGEGIFTGNESLEQGLYMVVMPDNRFFEIIMPDDQYFSVECSSDDFINTLSFEGSDENQYFIDYQKEWIELQIFAADLRNRLETNKSSKDSLDILSLKLSEHEKVMINFLKESADNYDGTIISQMIKALIPVKVPKFEISSVISNPDSVRWVMTYMYNKDHFFDNFDLADPRLIRTPLFHRMLNTFFTSIIIQHPDSIYNEIIKVADLSSSNPETFRYVIGFLFNHFSRSKYMGHDKIVVRLADDYYLSGEADWATKEFLTGLRTDVERLRTNLIGVKATDLVMETYTGEWKSLYDIRSEFTIIYFWEPDCGHCKTTTPLLRDIYNKYKDEFIEVFAICTQGKRNEWETYVADNQLEWINGWDPSRSTNFGFYYNVIATPLVYILDSNKIIIAKNIGVENIVKFIENYRLHGGL
ncbi:MAG: redoxin domain-containing protein [Bacteroidales bacterium]|nr:redoxin domain-containing protein [Bacteroidales bacterium]